MSSLIVYFFQLVIKILSYFTPDTINKSSKDAKIIPNKNLKLDYIKKIGLLVQCLSYSYYYTIVF